VALSRSWLAVCRPATAVPRGAALRFVETPAPHMVFPTTSWRMNRCSPSACIAAVSLAAPGHNHVIASHADRTIYVRRGPHAHQLRAHIPLPFTVDEASLLAAGAHADFPPELPDIARRERGGNMLGEARSTVSAPRRSCFALCGCGLPAAARAHGSEAGGEARAVLARVADHGAGQVRTIRVPVVASSLAPHNQRIRRDPRCGRAISAHPFSALSLSQKKKTHTEFKKKGTEKKRKENKKTTEGKKVNIHPNKKIKKIQKEQNQRRRRNRRSSLKREPNRSGRIGFSPYTVIVVRASSL